MSIDWNRAPEGATHWEPKGKLFCEGWMKKEGNKWSYWVEGRKVWVSQTPACAVSAEREATFEPRPQETWNGQGLPPVGTVCEHYGTADDLAWLEVEVIGHGNVDGRNVAFFRYGTGSPRFTVSYSTANNFRPIRTHEQIAAEEREKAIEEMCFAEETLTVKQAKALFDAGYRRQEEGK
ncbi:hypothetical protein [Pseudomonas aeruginosa]|uniref:hypothetical protein n=1 Tax=Pseudomonas aeruginosa TaxID=287 RepID=UPI001F4B6A2F|nr:hypothetical protein [Pseudomonas aeruginosa]